LKLVVFLTERLQSVDTAKDQLDNAVGLEFRCTNNFRAQEKSKEEQGLIGDFDAKDGKHGFKVDKGLFNGW